jgi:hypothetical protein
MAIVLPRAMGAPFSEIKKIAKPASYPVLTAAKMLRHCGLKTMHKMSEKPKLVPARIWRMRGATA